MKIEINELPHNYDSDFPHGWLFSKGDYFKKVIIDGHKCFVKRFEKEDPGRISGWPLLNKLKGKNKTNLARIHDVAAAKEGGMNVYYVFYEFIEGETLHDLIKEREEIDLEALTEDLMNGIRSLQDHEENYSYWFADFTESNILRNESGKYVLIDLDSTQPAFKLPDNRMHGDKEYWALVFKFYTKVLDKKNLSYSDINGISLNYLQVVFLILHIALYYSGKQEEYAELSELLPLHMKERSSSFANVFNKVLEYGSDPLKPADISEIRKLIREKIINVQPADPGAIINKIIEPLAQWSAPDIPVFRVINYIERNGDDYLIAGGKPCTLNWKVLNASGVRLYKNGVDINIDQDKTSITFTEAWGVREKKIKYTLRATNNNSSADRSLTIKVADEQLDDGNDDVYVDGPLVTDFKVNNYVQRQGDVYLVEGGQPFTLNWNVKNAFTIKLYKNESLFKVFDPGKESVELNEMYDGEERQIEYSIEASNKYDEIQKTSLRIRIIGSNVDSNKEEPVIKDFQVNNYLEKNEGSYVVESGKAFLLSWNINNALNIELYKNGQLYKKINSDENSITLTEAVYDGKEKEISFTIKALGYASKATSQSLSILIREVKPPKPVIKEFKANRYKRLRKMLPVLLAIFIVLVVFLYLLLVGGKTEFSSFTGEKINENDTITISGKNIPEDVSAVQVKFNGVTGKTVSQTKKSLRVVVPGLINNKYVQITVFVNGTPFTISRRIVYRDANANSDLNGSSINPQNTEIDTTRTNAPVVVSPFRSGNVISGSYITIKGENLPEKSGHILVKFNGIDGKLIQQTNKTIQVQVPSLTNTNSVKIIVYIDGNTYPAAANLPYNVALNHVVVNPLSFADVTEGQVITVTGLNLPNISQGIWIQFNNVKGEIVQLTGNSVRVQVPFVQISSPRKVVDIGVCVYGNKIPVASEHGVPYHYKN